MRLSQYKLHVLCCLIHTLQVHGWCFAFSIMHFCISSKITNIILWFNELISFTTQLFISLALRFDNHWSSSWENWMLGLTTQILCDWWLSKLRRAWDQLLSCEKFYLLDDLPTWTFSPLIHVLYAIIYYINLGVCVLHVIYASSFLQNVLGLLSYNSFSFTRIVQSICCHDAFHPQLTPVIYQ